METLGITHARAGKRAKWGLRPFWRQQFGEAATPAQVRFDVAFGVVLPVLCFVFDPIVFRGSFIGGALMPSFQFYAYSFSAIEICALGLWLGFGRRVGEWLGVLAGVLVAGGVFSLTVGVLILPFSLLGLALVIGALGFTPFLTALVYLRNGMRAAAHARPGAGSRAGLVAALVFGAAFALAVPAGVQWGVTRVVNESLAVVLDGGELSPAAVSVLRAVGEVSDENFDRLVWAYNKETDPARRARLAKAYRELTGRDIERRLTRLLD